jgi:hypothetical protein
MQERIERWLTFWVAKPIAWAIVGLWLALKYTWVGVAWCASRVRERWMVWRAKPAINGVPVAHAGPTNPAPTRRSSKRQAA